MTISSVSRVRQMAGSTPCAEPGLGSNAKQEAGLDWSMRRARCSQYARLRKSAPNISSPGTGFPPASSVRLAVWISANRRRWRPHERESVSSVHRFDPGADFALKDAAGEAGPPRCDAVSSATCASVARTRAGFTSMARRIGAIAERACAASSRPAARDSQWSALASMTRR